MGHSQAHCCHEVTATNSLCVGEDKEDSESVEDDNHSRYTLMEGLEHSYLDSKNMEEPQPYDVGPEYLLEERPRLDRILKREEGRLIRMSMRQSKDEAVKRNLLRMAKRGYLVPREANGSGFVRMAKRESLVRMAKRPRLFPVVRMPK